MKEGYRLLGDFIQPVDERNKELKVDYLLGVSISKQFIPSIANIVELQNCSYRSVCVWSGYISEWRKDFDCASER